MSNQPAAPSESFHYDQEKDSYYLINNETGRRVKVTPTGQNIKIYDLEISGVAETKQRNVLAGDREVLKYRTPESLQFDQTKSFYCKPPKKFVGYFQFCNSRANNYFKETKSEMPGIARRMKDSKSAPCLVDEKSSAVASEPGISLPQAKNHYHLSKKDNVKKSSASVAKLIQEQFNKTHSKRLSKIPSFLSTHLSSFATMNNLGQTMETIRSKRVPKPETYKDVLPYRDNYKAEVSRNRTSYAPPSRRAVEKKLADNAEREENYSLLGEGGSMASTIRERSVATLDGRSTFYDQENFTLLKTKQYFANRLEAQNEIKNIKLADLKTKEARPVLRGTLGVPIRSPNDLFESNQKMLKALHPQNFTIPKPRSRPSHLKKKSIKNEDQSSSNEQSKIN